MVKRGFEIVPASNNAEVSPAPTTKKKKKKKAHTNPLRAARSASSKTREIWRLKTGAGPRLFADYYRGQGVGVTNGPAVLHASSSVVSEPVAQSSNGGGSRAAKRRRKRKGLKVDDVEDSGSIRFLSIRSFTAVTTGLPNPLHQYADGRGEATERSETSVSSISRMLDSYQCRFILLFPVPIPCRRHPRDSPKEWPALFLISSFVAKRSDCHWFGSASGNCFMPTCNGVVASSWQSGFGPMRQSW
jgi:hypothetical protein